jgi:hypothetical protein
MTLTDLSLEGRLCLQFDSSRLLGVDSASFKKEAEELEILLKEGALTAVRFVFSRCVRTL